MNKKHIPASSLTYSLVDSACCGRVVTFTSRDHDLIRHNARMLARSGDTAHYCQTCLKRLLG